MPTQEPVLSMGDETDLPGQPHNKTMNVFVHPSIFPFLLLLSSCISSLYSLFLFLLLLYPSSPALPPNILSSFREKTTAVLSMQYSSYLFSRVSEKSRILEGFTWMNIYEGLRFSQIVKLASSFRPAPTCCHSKDCWSSTYHLDAKHPRTGRKLCPHILAIYVTQRIMR